MPTRNADTQWCMQLLLEVIAELIAPKFWKIHKDESELW